jgi:hypothetical protein
MLPRTLPAVLATALAALLVPLGTMSSASAVGLECLDEWEITDACRVFDTDGDGYLEPDATVAMPVTGVVPAGSTVPVTITGVDLLRPAAVGIHNLAPNEPRTGPENLVATATIAPGALTTTVNVPVGTTPGAREIAVYLDTWDVDGIYIQESFDITVAALPSSLTSDLPPGRIVKANAKSQAATGTVSGGVRPVHLQVRAKDGSWVTVAETTSHADGSYTLAVPTFWVGNHTYRAYAPEHGTLGAAETSKTGTLKVKRSYKPKGSNAHALMYGKARWNACAPIRYSVNTAKMPKWAGKEIRFALREASAATGLRFAKVAGTDHVPFARKEKTFPTHADLVVAFSNPKTVPGLRGNTIGLGGGSYSGTAVTQGGVVFDVAQKANKKTWRQIVLHEFGHALGLTHVGDRKQVMFPISSGKAVLYAKGDLTGLAAVGAGAGPCTSTETDSYRRTARAPHSPDHDGHADHADKPSRWVVLP